MTVPNRPATYRPAPVARPITPRLTRQQRGYGETWQRLRKLVLAEEPLCVECLEAGRLTPATEVDHHIALARGGTHDRSNLRPMCKPCHSRKTATEDGGGFRRGRGNRG
jgi:5-methylcytosine-specific restriction endonuclease McrA